jgi:branched-chain amino acid transport system substrate-binding protein
MKIKLFWAVFSVLLAILMIVTGCSNNSSSTTNSNQSVPTTTALSQSTSTKPVTTATQSKTIRIGALEALNDPVCLQEKKWFDIFVKMVNDAGGWKVGNDSYKLELVLYDTQNDSVKSKDLLSKLVLQDGVKFIVSQRLTSNSDVDVTVTEPNKVLVILGLDYTSASAKPQNQYFYTAGNYFASALPFRVYKDMASKGIKNYVSVKADMEIGHRIDPVIDSAWKLANPDIKKLDTVWVPVSTVDWGPIATKVVSYHPDAIDMIYLTVPAGSTYMYGALATTSYKGTILSGLMPETDLENIVKTCGKDIVEGGEVAGYNPLGMQKDPRMLSFINEYIKQNGKMETLATTNLNPMFLLEDAVLNSGSVDVETVKKYLDSSNHPVRGLVGWTQLFARPDLGNYRTVCGGLSNPVARITDGKLQNISNVPLKDQYLFTIISGNMVDVYKAYWAQYGYPTFPEEEKGQNVLNFSDLGISGHD